MKGEERRKAIISHLMNSENIISAGYFAGVFSVSRQIIVKDIARLRSDGFPILSYARGYVLEKRKWPERVFKTIHSDNDVGKELNLIVDLGGVVKDVFIYHKVYNKVSAELNIKTTNDIENFLENIASGKSSLLKNVTSGYHYHTVSAENVDVLDAIEEKLKECEFLAPLQEYEPMEMNMEE